MDFEAAGLLDGLEGEDRAARQRLLEQLEDRGVGLKELKDAVAEDRLVLLPVEQVVGGRYTAQEIEERTGLSAEILLRIRRLLGLPAAEADEHVFGEEDIDAAKALKLFFDSGFDEDAIAQITRVLGEAMARMAATTTGAFADAFLKPGDSEDEVALRFATLAEQLTPQLTPVLVAAFRAHLHEAVRRGMLGRAEREAGQISDAQEVAVCFADLVGFTHLGGQLEVEELGTVAGRLGELATEVAKPPVRLVKTIGDAAMFVSREVEPLVEVAVSLVEAVEEAEMPALRAGVAWGPAIQRAGDFYGHSVNLASRVTGIARPGSVLCTEEVRDAAADDFEWSFAGRHRLKGVEGPVPLHRARHRAAAPAPEETPADVDADEDATAAKAKKQKGDRRRRRASR
jgi:adenylate cyclase